MPEVYQAVNNLQKTPWRVNKKILQVIEEAKEVPSGLGGLPSPDDEPKPPKVWNSDQEFEFLKETQPEIIKAWKREAEAVETRRRTARGKRIALSFQLNMAKQFKNEPEIFFVYTMDFRGRVYPVQSYMNPQGDDVSKSLLEFAEGKPLGEQGAYWLKVHLANKYGVDKVSFDDRVAWVEENKHYILDSARRPLNGERFWAEADDPFQFLSACFEYLGYHEEGESFESHLPVAMDGTCNGLQHFSAMLKDRKGAKATNLIPSEKPQDIYQEVVDVVNVLLATRAMDETLEQEDRDHASLWLGKVDRSLIKRNVMTVPYAVTTIGMKDQILDELFKRDSDLGETGAYLGVEDNFQPAYFLAKLVREAVDEVVIAANEAKEYLQQVARLLSKEELPVYWKTPIGFLVYQNYLKQKSTVVNTFWGEAKVKVRLGLRLDTDDIDKRKQATAISPNFVHSFDSSHLMRTINTANEELGLTNFAVIHDSFGVHACDTEAFSQIIREEFASQYKTNVLEEWTEQIKEQLPEELIPELPSIPSMGNLEITKVIESEYFFA
jgi:DNA-directed RNA polymerase